MKTNNERGPLGLLVNVMGTDCTNGGATSGAKEALLVGPGVPQVFAANGLPILELSFDLFPQGVRPGAEVVAGQSWLQRVDPHGAGCRRVVRMLVKPFGSERRSPMFGGHFIYSSDSRFPTMSPLPVHDRFE